MCIVLMFTDFFSFFLFSHFCTSIFDGIFNTTTIHRESEREKNKRKNYLIIDQTVNITILPYTHKNMKNAYCVKGFPVKWPRNEIHANMVRSYIILTTWILSPFIKTEHKFIANAYCLTNSSQR